MTVRADGVRQVRIFEHSDEGLVEVARTEKKKRKRKRSKILKTPEKNVRVVLGAARTFYEELEDRHERSTRERKDGWIADAPRNVLKAQRKAAKKLRKLRII